MAARGTLDNRHRDGVASTDHWHRDGAPVSIFVLFIYVSCS